MPVANYEEWSDYWTNYWLKHPWERFCKLWGDIGLNVALQEITKLTEDCGGYNIEFPSNR